MESGIFNTTYQHLTENFEKQFLSERNFEPENLLAKRSSAFQVFNLKGFPSVKNEDWRFTNLHRLLNSDFQLSTENIENKDIKINDINFNASKIVIVNGHFSPELSDEMPEGVTFLNSAAAISNPLYTEKLGTIASEGDNTMLALNTAFFQNFYVIHIKSKKPVLQPVHISHHFSSCNDAGLLPYRLLVIADELSECTVVETFNSNTQQATLVSYVSEFEMAESAVLHTHLINALDENIHFIHHREVNQFRNSIFNNTNLTLGNAALIRNDLNCRLKGTGTETNLWGSYITSGQQHVDNHTIVDHEAPNCNSNELYKGIMLDRSHAVFNGKVFVRPDAQKTNAFQQNNNILLSDQATINSKPQLEILADDVKCSHGSTAGQFSEDALFYLRARGIKEDLAKRMLVEAFISQVHDKIDLPDLKEYVQSLLRHKLLMDTPVNA